MAEVGWLRSRDDVDSVAGRYTRYRDWNGAGKTEITWSLSFWKMHTSQMKVGKNIKMRFKHMTFRSILKLYFASHFKK